MNNHFFRAFAERSFLFLWIGEVFTQIAVNLFSFYLIFVIYQLTNSNAAVSAVVITFTLPPVIFGILAGVYTDRWNKKNVLLWTNFLRSLLLLLLVLFPTNIIVIFIVSILFSIITQFFIPAEAPIIPLVVKKPLLFSANALFGIGIFGSILVAYSISGPVLLYLNKVNTVIFISILLALGGILISFVKLHGDVEEEHEGETVKKAVMHEIRTAFYLLSKSKIVFQSMIFLAISQILMFIIAALAPGYAAQVLHVPVEEFSYLFVVPAAIGVIIGAFLMSNVLEHVSRRTLIMSGLLLAGFAMSFLPFASSLASKDFVKTINTIAPAFLRINNFHILSVMAFLVGLANAFVFVPANTIMQEKTPESLRGKIYGVLNTFVGLGSLLPLILVGGFSDVIGVDKVIMGIGIILLLLGLINVKTNNKL